MKKKFAGKLILNKKTVTNLNANDMNLIRGASFVVICSDSCSFVKICCDTKTNPIEENRDQAKDQG